MTTPLRCALPVALLLAPALAVADPMTDTVAGPTAGAPAEWAGPEPHLILQGSVAGYGFAVNLDAAALAGAAKFAAKREYLKDGEAFRYIDFEVAWEAAVEGIEKSVELEFENRDFAAHPVPAEFALQGEEFPEGLLSTLEIQFEWEAQGTTVNMEEGGWTGRLVRALDSGTPDAQGLLPDGMIGGFVEATRGEDRLTISFTVPVAEYEIED